MAFTKISLTKDGHNKTVPVGFSWTTVFFGAFVPLFRGDFYWFAIAFACVMANIIPLIGALVYLAYYILSPAFYNRLHIQRLVQLGWRLHDIDAHYAQPNRRQEMHGVLISVAMFLVFLFLGSLVAGSFADALMVL